MEFNTGGGVSALERGAMRKVTARLIPFLAAAYFFAGLDRVNVGFAALHMNRDVGLSPYIYGLGAGIFFISYCLFAVPSNMLMVRVGARRWLGIVMVAWGLVSAAMALTGGPSSFLLLRFLLGMTEAGFFPGVMLFLTYWFPTRYRSRVVALFMVALPVSNFLGSPLSAALLMLEGVLGLSGWHWMFLIEAVPATTMGLLIGALLPRDVSSANWLSKEEKLWLGENLANTQAPNHDAVNSSFWQVVRHTWVIPLALVYFGGTAVNNGIVLWQPQIIKAFALTDWQTGLVNSIPFAVGALFMVLWGRASDRRDERYWHVALPLAAASIALACSTLFTTLVPLVVILTFTIAGSYGFLGPFWALVSSLIPPRAAPIAIGLINSINSLGNFSATWLIGLIRGATGNFRLALLPLVCFVVMACLMVLVVGLSTRTAAAVQARAARHDGISKE